MPRLTDDPSCAHGTHPAHPESWIPSGETLAAAAAMLDAAGDAGRLRLLCRLEQGERCVTELAEAEDEKVPTISARLKLLHGARLVTRRREAKHVYYALADDHVQSLLRDILDHAAEGTP